MRLIILGNGFDLFNGLQTSYADFNLYVEDNDPELSTFFENHFEFQPNENYLWKDFENDLATFSSETFFDGYNHIDVMSESFNPNESYGLEDEITQEAEAFADRIRQLFADWIMQMEYPVFVQDKHGTVHFGADCIFISFNYTDTLEELYKVPKEKIHYIHGNANNHDTLVFGHGLSEEQVVREDDFDDDGEPSRTFLTDSRDAARTLFYEFKKNTEEVLNEHKSFFDELANIKSIMVLGHSLGEVDRPYFQKIAALSPDAKWTVSYLDEAERGLLKEKAEAMLSGSNVQVDMKTIDELLQMFREDSQL